MTEREIELQADRWKVHAAEKVSTGEYESHEVRQTIEGDIPRGAVLDAAGRKALKAKLLTVQQDLQKTVQRAGENRVALPESEDWGVHNGDGDTDMNDSPTNGNGE